MSKGLTIIDKDYTQWVENLSVRYRQSQIKAAVRVNRELLKYYWELGRDIEEMHVEERWGQSVIKNLSVDLQLKNPNSTNRVVERRRNLRLVGEELAKLHVSRHGVVRVVVDRTL